MRQLWKSAVVITTIGLILALKGSFAFADLGCPVPGSWSTDAQFEAGGLFNVNDSPNHNQLRLNAPPALWPYVYLACSSRGTVVRIQIGDPDDAQVNPFVVGEYLTAPDNMGKNPSRCTVDYRKRLWISHRNEEGEWPLNSQPQHYMGSVTRVALLTGGTRCDADGSNNPNGDYLKPPFEYCSVGEGPNGDWTVLDTKSPFGLIKTSNVPDRSLNEHQWGLSDSSALFLDTLCQTHYS